MSRTQKMTRFWTLALVVALAATALVGGQVAAQSDKHGGSLVLAYTAEPHSLAPWRSGDTFAHQVYTALYDGLVAQNENLEIVPALAHSWDVSDDGLIYTFYLREDVVFHNGVALDAHAIKWNAERWANPESGNLGGINELEGAEVVDDYTVELHLSSRNVRFLENVAGGLRAVLEPGAVEELGEDFGFQPVGTGPFKFSRWVTDSEITLVRNEDYWMTDEDGNQLPYLDSLAFRILPEASVRHAALVNRDIDLDLDVSPENFDDIEARDHLAAIQVPGVGYNSLRVLVTKEPFDDVRIRHAIAWAVDREMINEAVYFNTALPGYGMYSPTTIGYDPEYQPFYPQDLDKSRELLAEAGYPNGFSMDLIVATPVNQTVAELLQAQLAAVGIRVNIQFTERGIFLDGIIEREWDSYLDGITGRTDPSQYYGHLQCDGLYNGHDYCNEEVDRLALGVGLSEFTDPTDPERIELYRQTQQMIGEDSPLIILNYPAYLRGWQADVQDMVVLPTGRHLYTWTYRSDG